MTTVENKDLLEMIYLCVRYGLFTDKESKKIWQMCSKAIDREDKEPDEV